MLISNRIHGEVWDEIIPFSNFNAPTYVVFFASTQKKLCSPIFKDLAMALLMYETSSQNMIPLTHIQLCMSHFMWKSSQPWWNNGQWKRPRSVRFKLIIIWPAHGHHAWLRDFCPSDRFAQDWDDFTHYPVMPWVYVLGASHMVTTQGNDPEHIKDKSRFSSTPNKTSRDRRSVSIATLRRYAASRTTHH